jgi:hypothetical protein
MEGAHLKEGDDLFPEITNPSDKINGYLKILAGFKA